MQKKHLKYIILPVLAVGLLATGVTYAANNKTARPNAFAKLAEAIAGKFNLNTTDVQAVIDDTMATQKQEMKKNKPAFVDPLKQAVTDGKLTQAQADLITAKREEMKNSVPDTDVKNMTAAERTELMKKHQEELKKWASDNNIPEQYVMFMGGFGRGQGGFGGQHFGGKKAINK